jgi:hypothetical protein
MTRTSATLADLEAKRDAAARRADELQAQFEKYPHREIREARDAAVRLVDRYDETISTLTKPRRSRR